MNNQIQQYAFHDSAVRIHTDGDTVEYCARDIATALGYANPNDAMRRHCKGIVKRYTLETAGGMQEMAFISEGDVYRLIDEKVPHGDVDGKRLVTLLTRAGRIEAARQARRGTLDALGHMLYSAPDGTLGEPQQPTRRHK